MRVLLLIASFLSYGAPAHSQGQQQDFSAALVMLVSLPWNKPRDDRKCFFNTSVTSLVQHWRPQNNYPVILLSHYGRWTLADKIAIRETWALDFHFLDVTRVFHEGYQPGSQVEDVNNTLGTLDYKKMNHFRMKGFMQVPQLRRFRYLMGFDDDSCIMSPIHYDMMKEMHATQARYAYPYLFLDREHVIVGLAAFADSYMKEKGLAWANPSLRQEITKLNYTLAFYGNFDIIDQVRWRQPDVVAFVDAVVQTNHIFNRRWGDAPLKFLMAQMYWKPNEVYNFCDFNYQHSSWNVMPMCAMRCHEDAVIQSVHSIKAGKAGTD